MSTGKIEDISPGELSHTVAGVDSQTKVPSNSLEQDKRASSEAYSHGSGEGLPKDSKQETSSGGTKEIVYGGSSSSPSSTPSQSKEETARESGYCSKRVSDLTTTNSTASHLQDARPIYIKQESPIQRQFIDDKEHSKTFGSSKSESSTSSQLSSHSSFDEPSQSVHPTPSVSPHSASSPPHPASSPPHLTSSQLHPASSRPLHTSNQSHPTSSQPHPTSSKPYSSSSQDLIFALSITEQIDQLSTDDLLQECASPPPPAVPTKSPSTEAKLSGVVPSCEERTEPGVLVSGFSLVLPRSTLYSFCPHQR